MHDISYREKEDIYDAGRDVLKSCNVYTLFTCWHHVKEARTVRTFGRDAVEGMDMHRNVPT